jgi:NAD(P)-dependent dehydrogenase (short-subunit alcohol dehydrogenase family)
MLRLLAPRPSVPVPRRKFMGTVMNDTQDAKLLPDPLRSYTPPPDLLRGRRILVTGAGDGIGKAVAIGAARLGAAVVLLGRTERKLAETADAIEALDGAPAPTLCPFDLLTAGLEQYASLGTELARTGEQLDGLVNNASALGRLTPIELYDPATWMEVVHVNLSAQFMITQTCLPLLKKAPQASIIFVSSTVGREGRAYWGAYAVSKFGVEGLMQTLADELAENTRISVNSLNPGKTRTGMRRKAYPGEDPGTLPLPEDVAPAFFYLLGPDGAHLRGETLNA